MGRQTAFEVEEGDRKEEKEHEKFLEVEERRRPTTPLPAYGTNKKRKTIDLIRPRGKRREPTCFSF